MIRRVSSCLGACAIVLLIGASAARAEFGLSEFHVSFTGPKGEEVTQAGSHPFAMTTSLRFDSIPVGEGNELEEAPKDIFLSQAAGFVGNPTAVPRCSTADFVTNVSIGGAPSPSCPDATAVGVASVGLAEPDAEPVFYGAVYNLEPPPGVAAKLGFWIEGFPVTVELGVAESPPYQIVGGPTNITQVGEVVSSTFVLWGNPASSAHDPLRGHCLDQGTGGSVGNCSAGISETPFLTLPRSCDGPLVTSYSTDSWQHPARRLANGSPDLSDPSWASGFTETPGMTGCGKLNFEPAIGVAPTTSSAESASGLDLGIDVDDEGVVNSEGNAQADIEATEFALPTGVTVNPSAAEGLGVCSKAEFEASSLTQRGCPEASKLGTLEVETPVLEGHVLRGSFYLATPDDPSTPQPEAENPFDSLLAAYLMIRDEELGVFVKLPAEIETDEATGQIVTTVEELPPFPLSRVNVHLRSGPRAPLVTPPTCGPYTTEAALYPSSGAEPLEVSSTFHVTSGVGGAPCPAGIPPFAPGFDAGSANSAASVFSPFSMRLTRSDGQQDITRFSATLPRGVTGKLAGLAKCSDAAIAAAKTRTGRQELASPSCPSSSRVGRVLGGAGVGTALTYVPGSLYLAGPYNGAPLSVVAIVPAVAGPFDVGTVVTRVALNLNPTTAQVEVDGAASDPIPHILKGIPLKVRDLQVFADRPSFTLNPTSCAATQTVSQIFGSGANVFNPADDSSVQRTSRFQAASCASLAFKPKLSLQLKGGTKRAKHPALHSTVTYPYPSGPGYANIGEAVVILPSTEFIDNAHINNPCTRVQFNASQCPPGSILGTARAETPLLDEPLEGPVYFRSNGGERNIPDVVADLHGLVHIVLVGFVDTATPKTNPRIRTTFKQVPDAPVTKFTLDLFGGKKGLLVNSADLCKKPRHATIKLTGQNGRPYDTEPAVKTSCKKNAKHKSGRAKR